MHWKEKLDALGDDERALIATVAKTWLLKGEDPAIVTEHVRRWVNKNNSDADGGGEGSKPPDEQRDPTQELEDLVNAHMAARGISRSKAYSEILRSRPDINAALAQQRNARLRKAAQAAGGNYGTV
jgi:hypothetical protein